MRRVTYLWVDDRGRPSKTPAFLITTRRVAPLLYEWDVQKVVALRDTRRDLRPRSSWVPGWRIGHGCNITRRIALQRARSFITTYQE